MSMEPQRLLRNERLGLRVQRSLLPSMPGAINASNRLIMGPSRVNKVHDKRIAKQFFNKPPASRIRRISENLRPSMLCTIPRQEI